MPIEPRLERGFSSQRVRVSPQAADRASQDTRYFPPVAAPHPAAATFSPQAGRGKPRGPSPIPPLASRKENRRRRVSPSPRLRGEGAGRRIRAGGKQKRKCPDERSGHFGNRPSLGLSSRRVPSRASGRSSGRSGWQGRRRARCLPGARSPWWGSCPGRACRERRRCCRRW